jgi:hypothetical protein
MEQRIIALESSVGAITTEIKSLGDLLVTGFRKVDNNFEKIGNEIKVLHGQIEVLNKKVDLLQGDTKESLQNVDMRLENLSDEISKIGTVTKYEEYFNNLKVIRG